MPFEAPVRVRYEETDRMGVVYHSNYFVWFEVSRTDLLRNNGWTYREMEADGIQLPVIEAHCEYRKPAKYDDQLVVEARFQRAGQRSDRRVRAFDPSVSADAVDPVEIVAIGDAGGIDRVVVTCVQAEDLDELSEAAHRMLPSSWPIACQSMRCAASISQEAIQAPNMKPAQIRQAPIT